MPKKTSSRVYSFNRVNWRKNGRTERNAEKARNKAEERMLSRMNWNNIKLHAPPTRNVTPKRSPTYSPIPLYRFGPITVNNAYFKRTTRKKAHKP